VNANDTAKIPGAVAAAQAVATTKEDRYMLGQLWLKAAIAAKDDAQTAQASALILNSGMATADQVRILRDNQARIKFKAKDYAGALTELQALLAASPNDADALVLLGETYENQGNGAQAVDSFQKAIAARKAAGQPVPAEWQRRTVALAYKHKLPTLMPLLGEWVRTNPSPDNVRDAARIVGDTSGMSDSDQIDLFRLQRAAGALKGESDFYRYSNSALIKGFPGEAKAVLDEGFASGAINKTRPVFRDVYTSASSKVAADQAALATTEKNGLAASTARQALVAGDVFLGYGQYTKAAALYRAALTKSGADADLINLRLGIALARAGDKAGATAALQAARGKQQQVAQLWQAWVASRS
jgi:tetratricopeptide (TPR) repeat protein